MSPDPHSGFPPSAMTSPPRAMLLALALLGFAVAIFADHIASYYLLQWAPTLRRYPTQEERAAVLQALALDRAVHLTMWASLLASLWTWRRASRRHEAVPGPAAALTWLALGIASYSVLRVVVESRLAIHLVRVPNIDYGIAWHGPGFGVAGMALLAVTLLAASERTPTSVRVPR